MTGQTFATAKTRAKANGAADELLALKADVYNALEAVKESQREHERRLEQRLDGIESKLDILLAMAQMSGEQAKLLLRGK